MECTVVPVKLPDSRSVDPIAHLKRLQHGPFRGVELRAPAEDPGWVEAAKHTRWVDRGVRERWRGPLTERPLDPDVVPLKDLGSDAFRDALEACLVSVADRFSAGAAALLEDWAPIRPVDEALFGVLPGIGVVVPRLPEPELGALLFIGVQPAARGTGAGRRLHDAALALLYRAGARTYEDETEASNAPMLALFRHAGLSCAERWRALEIPT